MKTILMIFLTAFIYLPSLAGSVKVVIKAPNGEAIEGASVELIDVKTGNTVAAASTAADGTCEFNIPVMGKEYKLRISYIGYKTTETAIFVPTAGSATFTITLSEDTTENTDLVANFPGTNSIHIPAKRTDTPSFLLKAC